MGLALDEPNERETVFDDQSLAVLADESVMKLVKENGGVLIAYITDAWRGGGFRIQFLSRAGANCAC